MKLRKQMIIIYIAILICTTLIAGMIIFNVSEYRHKFDTIEQFKECKKQGYDSVQRMFVNDSDFCMTCVDHRGIKLILCD